MMRWPEHLPGKPSLFHTPVNKRALYITYSVPNYTAQICNAWFRSVSARNEQHLGWRHTFLALIWLPNATSFSDESALFATAASVLPSGQTHLQKEYQSSFNILIIIILNLMKYYRTSVQS
jgi:hypothetical protein